MLRYRSLMVGSNLLALLTVSVIWMFLWPDAVNGIVAFLDGITAVTSRFLGRVFGVTPGHAQIILQGTNGGGQILITFFALIYFWLFARRYPHHPKWMLKMVILVLMVHLILAVLWLLGTDMMIAWRDGNLAIIVRVLQMLEWHQAQTLTAGVLANMFVFVEMFVLTFIGVAIVDKFFRWLSTD